MSAQNSNPPIHALEVIWNALDVYDRASVLHIDSQNPIVFYDWSDLTPELVRLFETRIILRASEYLRTPAST